MNARLSDHDLLARLVEHDTTSSLSNLPLADFLANYLDRPGIDVRRNLSEDGEKCNLVVRMGPPVDSQRRGLVLSGHMDVVPAGEGWSSDPFRLTDGASTEYGEVWLGRGSADMKGFVALAVNAAAELDPASLTAPLWLLLTYDEEVGCLGARRLAESWPAGDPPPRHGVIGEPTSFTAVRMHKGHLKVRITLDGVSAHSGYPHLGVNAIEPAAPVIAALSALRRELEGERHRHSEHFPETSFVALNVARIQGGTAINVVPERCLIEVGVRLLPEMDSAPLLERIEAAVASAGPARRGQAASGEPSWHMEVLNEAPPMLLGEEAPIYRAVCELTGQRETVSASYGTDAAWLQHMDIDCVIFGPGTIEVAHKPDERLPKVDLVQGRELVGRLIDRFCRAGEGAGG